VRERERERYRRTERDREGGKESVANKGTDEQRVSERKKGEKLFFLRRELSVKRMSSGRLFTFSLAVLAS
jgi:hypothetical protein